jgi:mono/diheme cytochrome c family protein
VAAIDRRQVDPGPYYVCGRSAQHDPTAIHGPISWRRSSSAPTANATPHRADRLPPEGAGLGRVRDLPEQCIACHAINGEGGTIGPELNVPQSIVEYRPEEQLKAYIRKPEAFRYTSMPSHEHLTPADLDAVIAYFRAMRDRKHDPKAASRTEAP